MTSIPVQGQSGTILGLEVVPAADGSNNLVPVVQVQNASDITIGGMTLPDIEANLTPGTAPDKMIVGGLVYRSAAPTVASGQTVALQGDSAGNLKVNIAASGVSLGSVSQGAAGSSAWKVDPSGVTSPVSLASGLPAGTNPIGGTFPAPTSSADFAIAPASSGTLEAYHVLKPSAANLYSLYVMTTSVAGYVMTFNTVTPPNDGPVMPMECVRVPADSVMLISADGSPPEHYSVGIVAVFSTTGPFTKTASPTAFFKWCVDPPLSPSLYGQGTYGSASFGQGI